MTRKRSKSIFGSCDQHIYSRIGYIDSGRRIRKYSGRELAAFALQALICFEVLAQVATGDFGTEYSRSTTELDINGRTVGLRFGAATVGFTASGPLSTHISAAYGQGYDPSVSASFLSINASGPARTSVLALAAVSPSVRVGPVSLATGLAYRQQSAKVNLKGTDGEDPFTGRFNLRLHGVTPYVQADAPLPFGIQASARMGYQRWGVHYEAYGELGRVRIRTESNVSAWGPNLSLGLAKSFGRMTFSVQGSAYRLDADNRVWVPGVQLGLAVQN
jgi:hypothetical protein